MSEDTVLAYRIGTCSIDLYEGLGKHLCLEKYEPRSIESVVMLRKNIIPH